MKTLQQRRLISEGDDPETIRVDFTNKLDSSETLASVTSPQDENDTGDLTLSGEAVDATGYTDMHRRNTSGDYVVVAANKAIIFSVSGQQASRGRYTISFSVTTSTGRVLARQLVILVA